MQATARHLTVEVRDPDDLLVDAFDLDGTLNGVKTELRRRALYAGGRLAMVRKRPRNRRETVNFAVYRADRDRKARPAWIRVK
jgi:hypothetical protein